VKIAFIGPRGFNDLAGIDRVTTTTTTLAKRLAKRDHLITFYHHTRTKDSFPGITLKYIPTIKSKFLETPLYAIFATFNAIFNNFDIIHFQGLGSSFCTVFARAFTKAKIITTIHAPDWEGKKWGPCSKLVLKIIAKLALTFSHAVTTVSEANKKIIEPISKKKINVVVNGIDIPDLKSPKEVFQGILI